MRKILKGAIDKTIAGLETAKKSLSGFADEETKLKRREMIDLDRTPEAPSIFVPSYGEIERLDDDMLIVNFMSKDQCDDLIAIADKHNGWEPLPGDKFPAYEIRMRELGFWEELVKHWERHIYPIIERYWWPMEMYGIRDAFVMKYSLETQRALACHTDASLVTGSVKLNDDYAGANLVFPRQGVSNEDVEVGKCILFPGQVSHGHECTKLRQGTKYSLTMWSSRHPGDIGGGYGTY